jgi:hypothetical protein
LSFAVRSNNKIHNKFPVARPGAGAAPAHLSLTLAPPNKVTPTRVILFLSPHYLQDSRKRLAVALSGAFSHLSSWFSLRKFGRAPAGRLIEKSAPYNPKLGFSVNARKNKTVN